MVLFSLTQFDYMILVITFTVLLWIRWYVPQFYYPCHMNVIYEMYCYFRTPYEYDHLQYMDIYCKWIYTTLACSITMFALKYDDMCYYCCHMNIIICITVLLCFPYEYDDIIDMYYIILFNYCYVNVKIWHIAFAVSQYYYAFLMNVMIYFSGLSL